MMQKYNLNDTIAAIATSAGEAGIGIVRLSGPQALKIADKVFFSKDGVKPSAYKTYTVHYGWIVGHMNSWPVERLENFNRQTKIIDEVLLTVMRSPRSYTREDVVEINCHGGIVAMRAVLELVLENGARMAEPGEFTKRAFLNGRIDLAQAEAVLDIIRAKTDSALRLGVEQLKGEVSRRISQLRNILLEALSVLEAGIDFPEEELGIGGLKGVREALDKAEKEIKSILDTARRGRVMREGLHVVICGRPNVGKSSLLNALLRQERSIVTPVPGTTRDTIEEIIDIKGIPVRIVDTAGILEPRDLVEKKAVQRSHKSIGAADLVILLFDGSRKICAQDKALIKRLKNKKVIAVINKIDLKQKIERGQILNDFKRTVDICAKKPANINLLEDAIASFVYKGEINFNQPAIVSSLRHIRVLSSAQKLIAEAAKSSDNKLSPEFIAQDAKDALALIDELLGKRFSEDLLEKIFADFCIGK